MNKDLFYDILDENSNINEYDLKQIISVVDLASEEGLLDIYNLDDKEFYQNIIDAMQDNGYDLLTLKRLKEFIEEDIL